MAVKTGFYTLATAMETCSPQVQLLNRWRTKTSISKTENPLRKLRLRNTGCIRSKETKTKPCRRVHEISIAERHRLRASSRMISSCSRLMFSTIQNRNQIIAARDIMAVNAVTITVSSAMIDQLPSFEVYTFTSVVINPATALRRVGLVQCQ